MASHLFAFNSSVANGSVLVQVNALSDQALPPTSNNLVVPGAIGGIAAPLNKISAIVGIGATIKQVQLQSPSLRAMVNMDVSELIKSATPTSPFMIDDYANDLIPLAVGEQVSAFAIQGAVGSEQETVLVWLTDGAYGQVAGEIVTVRATGTTTLVANAWTNGSITLGQNLPAGRYQLVGAKVQSAGLLAARFVFPGGYYRPGVVGVTAETNLDLAGFRRGRRGVMGEFSTTLLPSVDYLSSTADTSEALLLDVVQVSTTP